MSVWQPVLNQVGQVVLVRLSDVGVVLSTETEGDKSVQPTCAKVGRNMWKNITYLATVTLDIMWLDNMSLNTWRSGKCVSCIQTTKAQKKRPLNPFHDMICAFPGQKSLEIEQIVPIKGFVKGFSVLLVLQKGRLYDSKDDRSWKSRLWIIVVLVLP